MDLAVLDGVEQAAAARELDRLRREAHLLVALAAPARDERQVGDRGDADDPLVRARRELGRLAQPALGLVEVVVAEVRPADRPRDHGPPRGVGPLELRRAHAVLDDPRRVAPAERRGEHRQAGLQRREAVRERPLVEPSQLADTGDGGPHGVLAAAQRRDPGLDEQQPGVGVDDRIGEAAQPLGHGRRPADVGVVHPALRDEAAGLGERARGDGVMDRLVGRAVLGVPLVRAAMQLRDEPGLAALQLDAEDLREEVVEAEPAPAVVEGKQEQVRAGELLEGARRARLAEDGAAQRRAEPLEHGRAQHEALQVRAVCREDLGGQEVDDVGGRAVERAHQAVAVVAAGERQRGQVDPRGPALGPRDEELDVGRRQPEAEATVEELRCLGDAEAKVVGAQLEELAPCSEGAERQRRVGARREDELDGLRHPLDEPGDALARRVRGQPVEVVEDERDLGPARRAR